MGASIFEMCEEEKPVNLLNLCDLRIFFAVLRRPGYDQLVAQKAQRSALAERD